MNIKHLIESQLKATQLITRKYGQKKALEFLLEETLYVYLKQKEDKDITTILPLFMQKIKKQFDDKIVNEYLTSLKEESQGKTRMVEELQKALKLNP